MWIDVTVLAIFFLCVILGLHRGFVRSLAQLAGSLGAFLAGYFFCDDLALWARENTEVYETIHGILAPRLEVGTAEAAEAFLQQLPETLAPLLEGRLTELSGTLAETAANLLLSILCFVTIVLGVRLVLFVLIFLFSKKYRSGLAGFADGLFGCAFGIIEGLFLVFLFLALLVPVSELLDISGIPEALESSRLAHYLYDNNLLFLIAEKYLVEIPAGL
ncbi:MAG: CvpA family protein [Clostridiales bacterium]|nr:CvpA family protein [Clostridiales bacterium]